MPAARVALMILAFLAWPASAWPPLYGAEFTFSSPEIQNAGTLYVDNSASLKKLEELKSLLDSQKTARGIRSIVATKNDYGTPAYRVVYEDGWSITLTTDPGVIEITTEPSGLSFLRKKEQQDRIQRDIFDATASLGLKPDPRLGMGHIHVGLKSAFGGNARLLRNVLADFHNHDELARGIFGQDDASAPALKILSKEKQIAFARALNDFDFGGFPNLESFVGYLNKQVFYESPIRYYGPKFQAVALRTTKELLKGLLDWRALVPLPEDKQTMELRFFRAQRSVAEFIAQLELIEARMEKLQKLKGVVRYEPWSLANTVQEKLDRFYAYVVGAGKEGSWAEYQSRLPLEYLGLHPTAGSLERWAIHEIAAQERPVFVSSTSGNEKAGLLAICRWLGHLAPPQKEKPPQHRR